MTVRTAPAKLTVSLRVTGVRADGYHLIDAEMVSLDLGDEIEFTDEPGVAITGPAAGALAGPASSDDLVVRALAWCGAAGGAVVTKRIPPGAGLGGGSSDAATVLHHHGCRDVAASVELGADVPFCVHGGRARVSGIGEVVEPLAYVERRFTLLTPPVHSSTPAVYRRWDELGGPTDDRTDGFHNDLTAAALDVSPELARWRDELGSATGRRPVLAGSGSTWFVEGAFPGPGRVVATTVPAR